MNSEDGKLLVKISEMYYLEDKNQNQIAKELNIHRTTISKLLKRARTEGIVSISINYDTSGTYHIEKQLEDLYGLKKVIVVPTAADLNRTQKDLLLGQALAAYLETILQDDLIIGFSWGETMSAVSKSLQNSTVKNTICVPMIGGPSGRLASDYHVNTITYEASKKLNGKALLIDSPAFPETLTLKKALMANSFNQELIDYWRKISVAIFGIGTPNLKLSENWHQFYGEDIFAYLEEQQVAGDIVSRFYDINGKHIDNDLDDNLIGIDINELCRIPYRIGVAEAIGKAEAIIGAIRGEYLNILVTTEETAQAILNYSAH